MVNKFLSKWQKMKANPEYAAFAASACEVAAHVATGVGIVLCSGILATATLPALMWPAAFSGLAGGCLGYWASADEGESLRERRKTAFAVAFVFASAASAVVWLTLVSGCEKRDYANVDRAKAEIGEKCRSLGDQGIAVGYAWKAAEEITSRTLDAEGREHKAVKLAFDIDYDILLPLKEGERPKAKHATRRVFFAPRPDGTCAEVAPK
jgi:hypothetical protein